MNVAVWFVFGYLVLNTVANLASNSKIERYSIGALSAIAAGDTRRGRWFLTTNRPLRPVA